MAVAAALSIGFTAGARATGGTQVIADEAAGIVRVMVKGKEVARFDGTGVHVEGDVMYAGRLQDTDATTKGQAHAP